jgi:acyl carrier protein
MATVQDKVIEIIARESGIDRARISGTSTLKDMEIPSLDVVQIMFAIEEEFKIYLPTDTAGLTAGTLSHLVAEIERQLASKSA